MSKKRRRESGAAKCKCSKCGMVTHSIPQTTHRRCTHKKSKGVWQPA